MNIDIVLGWATGRGGVETVTTLICVELEKQGHQVRVLQSRPAQYPSWEQTLPSMRYYDPAVSGGFGRFPEEPDLFRLALGYRAVIDQIGAPDVILASHTPFISAITRLSVGYGKDAPAIVSWLHGPPAVFGDPSGLRLSDGHLAISSGIGEDIRAVVGVQTPIFVVGNPVMLQVPMIERPDGSEFLFIGRLENDQKNIAMLIRALADLAVGPWHLTIIGDGSYRNEMMNTLSHYKIADKVTVLGWSEDPWSLVQRASLLILSSNFEGFGVVLVEALARGIPVVSTRTAGPTDIVDGHGTNGWMVPVGDHAALTQVLSAIVSDEVILPSPEACVESVQKYQPSVVAKKIVAALEEVQSFRHGRAWYW